MKSTKLMKLVAFCLIIRVIVGINLLFAPLDIESASSDAVSIFESFKMLALIAVFVEIILAIGIFRSNSSAIYYSPAYFLLLFILQFSGKFYFTFPSPMVTAVFYLIGIAVFVSSIMENSKVS